MPPHILKSRIFMRNMVTKTNTAAINRWMCHSQINIEHTLFEPILEFYPAFPAAVLPYSTVEQVKIKPSPVGMYDLLYTPKM